MSDPAVHEPAAQQLVAEATRSGHVEATVVALRASAWALHVRLDNVSARRQLDRAARLAERHGLDGRLGEVLLSRAAVSLELGRVAAARHDLAHAALVLDDARRAEALLQQGALHHNAGDVTTSVRLYRAALDAVARHPDAGIAAKAANNLAIAEAQLGRFEAALRHLDLAGRSARECGPVLVAIVAQTRAWVTVQAGRLSESLDQFAAAEQLYRDAGLPLDEHYIEYADALVDLRLVPEALRVAQLAVDELESHGAELMAAEARLRLARLLLLTENPAAARDAANAAAAAFRRQRRTAWVARATVVAHEAQSALDPPDDQRLRSLRGCARTLERAGLRSEAIPAYLAVGSHAAARGDIRRAVLDLATAERLAAGAPVIVRMRGRVAGARLAALRGDRDGVLRRSRAGLRDLARHRAALPSMELRTLASGHGAELGTLALQALLPDARPVQVLEWLERTRAAALLGSVQPASTPGGREAAAGAAPRRAAPARVPRPVPMRDVRAALGDAALVEYGCSGDDLVAVVLDRRRARLVHLGSTAAVGVSTDRLLFALRRLSRPASAVSAAAARASAEAELDRLRTQLVAPLGLDEDAPLVVVPVGQLQRLPWSPLHRGPVSVAPSAAAWLRTHQAAVRPVRRVTLVAGPRLPGAVAEVEGLAALHAAATTLVPPQSTVDRVLDALADADLAHLACHGHVRADNPMYSALEVSDGVLTVQELTGRRTSPHRIVLAACDSGVQTTYPGDETLGFVTALLARGTAALLASAVLVPDVDAVPLMTGLHEQLREGATMASALHAARAGLDSSQPPAFVTWCAFTAYGAA